MTAMTRAPTRKTNTIRQYDFKEYKAARTHNHCDDYYNNYCRSCFYPRYPVILELLLLPLPLPWLVVLTTTTTASTSALDYDYDHQRNCEYDNNDINNGVSKLSHEYQEARDEQRQQQKTTNTHPSSHSRQPTINNQRPHNDKKATATINDDEYKDIISDDMANGHDEHIASTWQQGQRALQRRQRQHKPRHCD